MSVEIPKLAVVLGSITPPQGDFIEARVHLGATKEVSSWELLLQNWDKKYSPGGTYPIIVGQDGHIDIGRGVNVPQIITTRTESIKYESGPNENYLRVSGRCWGEKLFRRVVTKTYSSQKGEAIVKDLLDYYSGLSHVRDTTELVENTDTTYTKLEYENTPVWDILKFIAGSADKVGVIGFDFRVAPDAKFEFFPRNSKTSSVSLSEKIEQSEYRKDIFGVRNKITIYGAQNRMDPSDGDAWTEPASEPPENWVLDFGEGVHRSGIYVKVGSYSVFGRADASTYRVTFHRNLSGLSPFYYSMLKFWCLSQYVPQDHRWIRLLAPDDSNYFQKSDFTVGYTSMSDWRLNELPLGKSQEYDALTNPNGIWVKVGNPSWFNISAIKFEAQWNLPWDLYIDGLFFDKGRFKNTQEDSTSQSNYGIRELVDTDEELYSDNECMLRAKAILAQLKDPAEYLTIKSAVIDYGTTPLFAGDKIHVVLPNENVDADFRILTVEYVVDAKTQTLEITMELGREVPLLADYLYALRSKSDHMSRHKIARMI
jgi:hypothetical protein